MQLVFLFLLFGALASCEGAIDLEGHVYDKVSMRPIDRVRAILVLNGNDTIWNCKPYTNSHGRKDLMSDNYEPAFTDINGHFSISSGLIAMGPGETKADIIFIKNDYLPVKVTAETLRSSDTVYMQRP